MAREDGLDRGGSLGPSRADGHPVADGRKLAGPRVVKQAAGDRRGQLPFAGSDVHLTASLGNDPGRNKTVGHSRRVGGVPSELGERGWDGYR